MLRPYPHHALSPQAHSDEALESELAELLGSDMPSGDDDGEAELAELLAEVDAGGAEGEEDIDAEDVETKVKRPARDEYDMIPS